MLPVRAHGILFGVLAVVLATSPGARAGEGGASPGTVRLGNAGKIVDFHPAPATKTATAVSVTRTTAPTEAGTPYPRPPVVGFSPLVAIVTSDARESANELNYEHQIETGYVGNPLNPPASQNFIIGILDSGADVDLFAGTSAGILGLTGDVLTSSPLPLGGAGGTLEGVISWPVGTFAAGLAAIDENGTLNTGDLVGHSNVAVGVTPPIVCGEIEAVSGLLGNTFISFHKSIIRVDTPREVTIGGETYKSPDVQFVSASAPTPDLAHQIGIEFGGLSPVTTASYYPDFFDLETPVFPTLMSFSALSIPFGGAYFATLTVSEDQPEGGTLSDQLRVLVDTGAQTSIISPLVAANLGLPAEPDFTVEVCGIGGLSTADGYYVDLLQIPAIGGTLRYSQVPVVVLNLSSPEGGSLDGILGMHLFWNRNISFEPDPTGAGFLQVSAPIPLFDGDFDFDMDVDHQDVEYFETCATSPGVANTSPECLHLDIDGDTDIDGDDFGLMMADYGRTLTFAFGDFDKDFDVDQVDFVEMQSCFSGSGVAIGDPLCAAADADFDNDVDQADMGRFQRCLSGENVSADPDC